MKRKYFGLIVLVAAVLAGCLWLILKARVVSPAPPIKVGILHSLTGTMAISEKAVVDAALLAIEEINTAGGLIGRQIRPVVADGRSDWGVFAAEAERLITQEKVSVVFGCWTSASRRTVIPVFEKYDHLLFYPVQYEGMEGSQNVVYTGAAPNQQIIPAVKWSFDNLGKRFFLVASDYVFPRAANEIIKDQIAALGGEIVGEEYILLGSTDLKEIIAKIVQQQPGIILNTINGDTNIVFLKQLREAGITPDKIPVLSFSISENELAQFDLQLAVGDYAAWNYFQSVDTDANKDFIANFKNKYGADRVVSDPMEAAYVGVHLWAQAVRDAGTDEVHKVQKFIANQSFLAPEGIVYVDTENRHLWKTVRIGRVRGDGQFDIVWSSDRPMHPQPYPSSRPRYEWDEFLKGLYLLWNENWANLGQAISVEDKEMGLYIQSVQTLSKDPVLLAGIGYANEANRGLGQEEIERLDRKWRDAEDGDPVIAKVLSNEASAVLRRFQNEHPGFREIFITDGYGLNVAMTNRTSDYYQADEQWWQKAYRSEGGRIVLGDIEYDRSAGAWVVAFFVPITGPQGETIGVMKALLTPVHPADD